MALSVSTIKYKMTVGVFQIERCHSIEESEYIMDKDHLVRGVFCLENLSDIDIIVNSIGKGLNLSSSGEISKTILKLTGNKIQVELNKKYPKGINPGEVAVTLGYNLPYQYVYHCNLQDINQRVSHHEIRETVRKCLDTAVQHFNGPPSIAFPAIGTGAMQFNHIIIKTIYCTILEFMVENPGSLSMAYVLVHPSQNDMIDYITTKVDPYFELERLTYKVEFPEFWPRSRNMQRVRLPSKSHEYKSVLESFCESIGRQVSIVQIEMIVNKRLFIAHEFYKHNLPNSSSTIKYLWHGTQHKSIDSIIKYGFDWRLTDRAMYGKGCYFAVHAEYSDKNFTPPNSQGEKCMFLVNVVAGSYCVGKPSMTEGNIPSHIQSTVDKLLKPTMFVTYNDDQMYPAFLVIYK